MARKEEEQIKDHQDGPSPTLKPDVTECMEFLSNWNESLLGFYFGRLQQYWKMPFEIRPFSSPEQYIQLHERFLEKMVADYAEQAEKLLEIARNELQASRDPSESEYAARLLTAQEDAAKIIELAKDQAEHIITAAEAQAEQTIAESEQQAASPKRRKSAL